MKELDAAIERAVGSAPVGYRAQGGGYSSADRFVVELADGRTVFVKSAQAENMAGWLRREYEVYSSLAGSFIPRFEGWDDDGSRPILAIEDLSSADWVPRWDKRRIDVVRAALAELGAAPAPPNTKSVRESFADLFGRWRVVAEDPEPFLSLGLRDAGWLDRNLDTIIQAADAAPVTGDALCHLDVRSDNLCFHGGRAVLVDWNWSSFANPDVDVAAWLPSVSVEGGPPPWQVLAGAGELAAFVAGVWAAVAGLPPPETAPAVRPLQRAQLAVGLDWIDRELEL
jgi:Phosphotransferase enzyme family